MKSPFLSPSAKFLMASRRLHPVALPGTSVLAAGLLTLLPCIAMPTNALAQSAASQLSTMAGQQVQVPAVNGPVCVPTSVSDCNFNSRSSSTTTTTQSSVQSQRAAQAQAARRAQQAQQAQQMQQVISNIINGNPQIAAEIRQKQAEIQQANTAHALQMQQEQESYTVQTARSAQARRDQKIADLLSNTIGVPPDTGDMSGLIKGLPPSQQLFNTSLENHKTVAGSGFDTPGPLMAYPVKPVPKASEPFDYRKTEAKDIPPERRTPEVNKLIEHREELRQKEAQLRKELANTPPNTQAWIDKSTAADKFHIEDNWDTFNISEELRKGPAVPSGKN